MVPFNLLKNVTLSKQQFHDGQIPNMREVEIGKIGHPDTYVFILLNIRLCISI